MDQNDWHSKSPGGQSEFDAVNAEGARWADVAFHYKDLRLLEVVCGRDKLGWG